MIVKCVALLAVVAQINAYVCNSNYVSPVVASGCGTSGIVGSSGIIGSSGLVGSTGVVGTGVAGTSATSRNVVAKGKYPIALENFGPVPDSRVPVTTSHVQAPVQQKPTVRLQANIPAPRTVAHSCTCYKQILRPRVHDQYITVPTVQRYIETTHTPVVENIHYEAVPVNCPSSGANTGALGDSSAAVETFPVASAYQSVPSVQAVPVSAVQTVQSLPVSSVQAVPVSTVQAVQAVPVSTVQAVQAVPVSTVQAYQAVPVSSSIQVASSLPIRSLSSGNIASESQGYCY